GNGKIFLWEAGTGNEIRKLPTGPYGAFSPAFSPDGKILAAGGMDNRVRLWNVASGKELNSQHGGHQAAIGQVAFSPDGKTLATAAADQTIRLWNAATGKELRQLARKQEPGKAPPVPLGGEVGAAVAIAFTPDGKTLVGGCADGHICFWDVATGKQ